MTILTKEDLQKCTVKQSSHLNGGREWFGYGYTMVEHPRLSMIDKTMRRTRETTRTYYVDGLPCADLDEALVKLQTPAVLNDIEQAVLDRIGDVFRPWNELGSYKTITGLGDKGFLDWDGRGNCRRRPQEEPNA